ncbi:MAG: methyltransferase domain-containing protein [Phycisphaeraceae bacterium]|nr:methyltransferase domain-containing protein [Phycisphaeraceae bacterium]
MCACQDAYGKAMMDYLTGRRTAELMQIGCKTWFFEYDQWFEREQGAMQYVQGRVLDVGCGAGRHSLYLQGRGCDVLAIDKSPLAIKVCRHRGVRETRVMSLTQVTRRLGLFDTILLLGNNFGLMANRRRARWILRRFWAMTRADARILAGSGDPAANSNPDTLAKMESNRRRGRMPGQFRMQGRYGNCKTPWFDWLFVSETEMEELVDGTGWRISRFLRDNTDAYVAVILKEHSKRNGGRSSSQKS